MKQAGLNVRVATLTGKKSEVILLEQIRKDFPDGLNKVLWINKEKDRLFRLTQDDMKVKSKTLLDYNSPKKYVEAYRHQIKNISTDKEKFEDTMKERPYRTNPFTVKV